ncbi:hypothetical protein HK096_007551 [Nowakowskiella sp. JEL0078]|nr:hypothetical protein HK096_007551 [Nowakowskiella sp. JEL0078]
MSATQDLPPPGGFPRTIRYERYIPKRGPSGAVIFAAIFGIMGYGWYWTALSNAERRELQREKSWGRILLVPLLQAETDRDAVRRLEAAKKREAEVMKNVEGWSPLDLKAPVAGLNSSTVAKPVYYTEKYVPPSFVFLPWHEETGERISSQWWRGTKMFTKNPPYHKRSDWKGKDMTNEFKSPDDN